MFQLRFEVRHRGRCVSGCARAYVWVRTVIPEKQSRVQVMGESQLYTTSN